jgi:asparagine N-glycosylation enzyme membrane subunit Stt3
MNIKIKREDFIMKKALIAGLFLVSVLLASGKEYVRNEDDSVNYFYTKVIIENNKVKMITKVVNKDDKSKSYIRTLTGEIKGNKIYYNKFQINQRKERDIPVEVSVFSEAKGKLFIDKDEFIEVIKK